MSRGRAWFLHVSALLVGGTGLVYGWMRYAIEPADEFALVNHPQQPLLQHLHLLCAPLLVFACGMVWSEHAWKRVRSGYPERRHSGLVLFALLVPMVVTGYLVQVAEGNLVRTLSIWGHGTSSGLWILGYLVHQLTRVSRARANGAQARRGNTGPALESTAASSRSA